MDDYKSLIDTAELCTDYNSIFGGFYSKIGEVEGKSCINCKNYKDKICNKNSDGKYQSIV
ncbi:MAG: hypothetical protein LIR50_18790 [Bacillota bacterium]|nr:hypothetical protein [Bacillota bacterium]